MRRYTAPRKKSPKRKLNQAVDLLIKEKVLEEYGAACLRCGKTNYIQASHILPKGKHPRLRFEVLNIIPLCRGCHIFFWHRSATEASKWLEEKLPGRQDQLLVMAATASRVDAKELLIALQDEKSRQEE
jgi:5-methylcytosine-specific restriction endonuclease McrA